MCVGDRRPGGERKSRTDRQREGDSQTQKREGERQKGESRGRQTKCDRIERGHTHTHTHTRARDSSRSESRIWGGKLITSGTKDDILTTY